MFVNQGQFSRSFGINFIDNSRTDYSYSSGRKFIGTDGRALTLNQMFQDCDDRIQTIFKVYYQNNLYLNENDLFECQLEYQEMTYIWDKLKAIDGNNDKDFYSDPTKSCLLKIIVWIRKFFGNLFAINRKDVSSKNIMRLQNMKNDLDNFARRKVESLESIIKFFSKSDNKSHQIYVQHCREVIAEIYAKILPESYKDDYQEDMPPHRDESYEKKRDSQEDMPPHRDESYEKKRDSQEDMAPPARLQPIGKPNFTPGLPTNSFLDDLVKRIENAFKTKEYYKLFDLDEGCTREQLTKSYRTLALKAHPDKNSEQAARAGEVFKELGSVYAWLDFKLASIKKYV